MKSSQIHIQKLQVLISGIIDDGKFNNEILKIRKKLKIPPQGLATSKESKEWHDWLCEASDRAMETSKYENKLKEIQNYRKGSKEFDRISKELNKMVPLNHLGYLINKLIREYPDLTRQFHSPIRNLVLFGPEYPLLGSCNWEIKMIHENGQKIPAIKLYGPLSATELRQAYSMATIFLKDKESPATGNDFDRDLRILQLSLKKGEVLPSTFEEIEDDGKYNDENIALEVFQEIETPDNIKKAVRLVRKRRSLGIKRVKKLFPRHFV